VRVTDGSAEPCPLKLVILETSPRFEFSSLSPPKEAALIRLTVRNDRIGLPQNPHIYGDRMTLRRATQSGESHGNFSVFRQFHDLRFPVGDIAARAAKCAPCWIKERSEFGDQQSVVKAAFD
jgi:hypothetical protein